MTPEQNLEQKVAQAIALLKYLSVRNDLTIKQIDRLLTAYTQSVNKLQIKTHEILQKNKNV